MHISKLSSKIKKEAVKNGFNLCGIAKPGKEDLIKEIDEWIDNGYHASMVWIENRKEERKNIFKYFPKVKSVISVGYNYYTDENDLDSQEYKISNYAWGDDYHLVIKKKLYKIVEYIKTLKPDFEFRVCVDTSPISEKYWAQKAGLGWIGKHTNLINNNIGSWFFIAEILIDFELEYDEAFKQDLCGTCTKCIEACPTDAIIDDYQLDSNKCISYLTIEHRESIANEFSDKLDNWIYGCDICQQICPWNKKFHIKTSDVSFEMRPEIKNMSKSDWNKLDDKEYKRIFKKSAVKRTKLKGLKRNINLNKKN